MNKVITAQEAKQRIVNVVREVIKLLPFEYEYQGRSHAEEAIDYFLTKHRDSLFIEFGTSFMVTATLSVSADYWSGSLRFKVSVSTSSGMRTLAQAQASHNLTGAVLVAASHIQAAIDSFPDIEKEKEAVVSSKATKSAS